MNKLKQIKFQEMANMFADKELVNQIKETKEPMFIISSGIATDIEIPDQLIDIEIALRKCRRVGVFKS